MSSMQHEDFSSSGRRLWKFHGGVHVPEQKSISTEQPVEKALLPKTLVLPLQQHIGQCSDPLVKVGDQVLKGQQIAAAEGSVSATLHAPTSGVIKEICKRPVPHASGMDETCIIIESDGEDRWDELPEPLTNYSDLDPGKVIERIRWAGIVGMGGAAFPSSVKLSPGPDRAIHTLIINGAECEPYITCDDMLMRQWAEKVVAGTCILRHVLDVTGEVIIGIEDNKPEAIAAMQQTLKGLNKPIQVVEIPTLYPSGGEKQLIRILTGQEVPSKGIPAHVGIVCHNVATAAAVSDAVLEGKPLISRIVTVTGGGIKRPGNSEVLIGTSAEEVINQHGGYNEGVCQLVLGGPMMGQALHTDQIPMTKGANCLLAAMPGELPDPGDAVACIRCGNCADVCPMQLLPQQLYWYARAKDMDKVQEYNLFDCIECGCCAHVCPSHIPLVHYYRFAKTTIWNQHAERKKAEQARNRHEARQARLARLEAERKAKIRKKKEALDKKSKGATDKEVDPKKAAIEAARKRAQEKRAAQAKEGVKPKNTEQLSEAQQKQIEAADKRRAEIEAEQQNEKSD